MRNDRYIATFFALLLLLSSCINYNDDHYSILEPTSPRDIFRSIFFMNGPLVDNIPSIKSKRALFDGFKLDEGHKLEIAEVEEKILKMIGELHPSYLADLKEALLGNSPYEIKERILEGSNLMISAVHQLGFAAILSEDEIESVLLEEGIDISRYDLSKEEDLKKLAEEVASLDPITVSKLKTDAQAALAVYADQQNKCYIAAAIAVAAVFLAVGILAAVRVVGVVFNAAFVYEYIHVSSRVSGGKAGGGGGRQETGPGQAPEGGHAKDQHKLSDNLLIADLVALN